MTIGPCLCGDPYCGSCGDPGAAEFEEWIDHLADLTRDFGEEEATIFETVGLAAVEAHRAAQRSYASKNESEPDNPIGDTTS